MFTTQKYTLFGEKISMTLTLLREMTSIINSCETASSYLIKRHTSHPDYAFQEKKTSISSTSSISQFLRGLNESIWDLILKLAEPIRLQLSRMNEMIINKRVDCWNKAWGIYLLWVFNTTCTVGLRYCLYFLFNTNIQRIQELQRLCHILTSFLNCNSEVYLKIVIQKKFELKEATD